MKGFTRTNQYLSLCGLNCGLCPMLTGGYCNGCGVDNQSCSIARCSLTQGGIEYCYECENYPCEKYEQIGEFDSFITHRRQTADLKKAKQIGIENYNCEQKEKIEILHDLLSDYNDGRKKSFYCTAVNLLELEDLREVLQQIRQYQESFSVPKKEVISYAAALLQKKAEKRKVELKLRKKKSRGRLQE